MSTSLPAVEELPKPTEDSDSVLLVDDDPDGLHLLREALACFGVPCAVAGSARQAIRRCNRTPPRALVTDLRMPGIDGQCLGVWARANLPDTLLVLLTGEWLSDAESDELAESFDVVLPKPVDLPRLVSLLERVSPPRV